MLNVRQVKQIIKKTRNPIALDVNLENIIDDYNLCQISVGEIGLKYGLPISWDAEENLYISIEVAAFLIANTKQLPQVRH